MTMNTLNGVWPLFCVILPKSAALLTAIYVAEDEPIMSAAKCNPKNPKYLVFLQYMTYDDVRRDYRTPAYNERHPLIKGVNSTATAR